LDVFRKSFSLEIVKEFAVLINYMPIEKHRNKKQHCTVTSAGELPKTDLLVPMTAAGTVVTGSRKS